MSVYRVLEKMESYIHDGTWLPAGMRVLSEERLMEFIEKVRSSLPEEVGRAKLIAKDQERMMRAAQEKAHSIVSEAGDHEIVQRARTTADVILNDAEERARQIRDGADQYAAQLLGELEARLSNALGSVRKGKDSLTPRAVQTQTPAAQPLAEAAAKSKRAAFDAQAPDETASLTPVS